MVPDASSFTRRMSCPPAPEPSVYPAMMNPPSAVFCSVETYSSPEVPSVFMKPASGGDKACWTARRMLSRGPIGLSVVIGSAELIRIFFTCMGDRIGCSDFISAAAPVTIGADAEVPQNVHQLELTTGAQTSPDAAR